MNLFIGSIVLASALAGWRIWSRQQRRKAVSAELRRSVRTLETLRA